ncbi:MAG: hypothetical protein ABW133_06020 [Polyangiaceae bacterium]
MIDAGEHGAASSRLQAAHTNLGRRPEYRYLVCLYDSTFHVRPDRDLLKEMIELVGEQPDLMEAAALLAQLYARLGDDSRADLFAHLALESANPSARARAEGVLKGQTSDADPPSSRVQPVDPHAGGGAPPGATTLGATIGIVPTSTTPPGATSGHPGIAPATVRSPSSAPPSRRSSPSAPDLPPVRSSVPDVPPSRPSVPDVPPSRPSSAPPSDGPSSSSRPFSARFPSAPPPKYHRPEGPPGLPEPPPTQAALDAWFDHARREVVHTRPTYGVKPGQSIVGMLLDWGKAVAEGNTFLSTDALPLNRDALALVDDVIMSLRRQPGSRSASRTDTSRAMAAAGFFLAVVLHELDAAVLEIAPDDGGCKVLLPSGAGARPLLAAAAFADGTGPSLVQTFDRLAAARELAQVSGSDAPSRRGTSMPAARGPSLTPVSSPALGSSHNELALSRPEVEASPLRKLDGPVQPADPPPLNMAAVAGALTRSTTSQDIAARSGVSLAATPASIEALDSFCSETRGEAGIAPERTVWPTSDEDEEIILTWGALLGETLIASYGGIWECDPNAPSDPRLFRVIVEDRVAAWPMTQVYLRLKNGVGYGMAPFVAEVGKLLE